MKSIWFIMLPVLVLFSCQKERNVSGDEEVICIVSADDEYTKGYVIDGSTSLNVGINHVGNQFVMDAWLEAEHRAGSEKGVDDNNNPHYIDNAVFDKVGTEWKNSACTWRNDVVTNFWAVFPKIDSGLDLNISTAVPSDAEQKTPTLTYDMSSLSVSHSVTNAAEQSKDILVAYARQKYAIGDEDSKSNISLEFAHALSAIKFEKGSTFTTGCDISYVTVGGIHLAGSCLCTGNPNAKPQSVSFVWTPTDTPAATDAFSLKQTTNLAGLPEMETGGKVLFLIPQELPAVATLSAYITKSSGTDPGLKTVNITGYSWKVGREYLYTLSYDEGANRLTVTVEETYSHSSGTWTD